MTMSMKDSQFNLSRHIHREERGKEIIIAKDGAEEVRFTPVVGEAIIRHPGRFGGEMKVTSVFLKPSPKTILPYTKGLRN
jgi:antitoxin (DNA-binding transcriptional repressor) of toxin-antitoxin stability system